MFGYLWFLKFRGKMLCQLISVISTMSTVLIWKTIRVIWNSIRGRKRRIIVRNYARQPNHIQPDLAFTNDAFKQTGLRIWVHMHLHNYRNALVAPHNCTGLMSFIWEDLKTEVSLEQGEDFVVHTFGGNDIVMAPTDKQNRATTSPWVERGYFLKILVLHVFEL